MVHKLAVRPSRVLLREFTYVFYGDHRNSNDSPSYESLLCGRPIKHPIRSECHFGFRQRIQDYMSHQFILNVHASYQATGIYTKGQGYGKEEGIDIKHD